MRRLIASLALLTLAAPAFAQDAAPAATASSPPPAAVAPANADIGKVVDPATLPALKNVVHAGTVLRYMGNEYGLKAYFITNKSVAQIIYLTPDEQGFLIGTVFSGDGTPTTLLQLGRLKQAGFDVDSYLNNMADYANGIRPLPPAPQEGPATAVAGPAPAGKASPGDLLMQDMNKASWIGYGPTSAPMITAFMDSDCESCHKAFSTLKPLADQGKIYLRVVPAGVITKDSGTHAVNVLSAGNPSDAWAAQMAGKAAPAPAAPNQQATDAIANNTALFWKWKLPGTPYMAYRSTSGEVKVIYGEPEDLGSLLADLGAK